MRLPTRRSDDADVIRARLRVLLDEGGRRQGWLPDDESDDDDVDERPDDGRRDDHPDHPDHPDDPNDPDGAARRGGPALPDGLGRHRAPGTAARVDPGRRGAGALWVAGLLAALALAGWTWLDRPRVEVVDGGVPSEAESISADAVTTADAATTGDGAPGPRPESPAEGEAADASATVVVSVVGLVARPGLVTLPTGARVADAVTAAGGLLPQADPASINLAAVVTDGEQIAIGVPGAASPAGAAAGPGGAPERGGRLNLNAATVAELDALPGIGPVLAQRIVDHRDRQGAFASVEQLDDVSGIGPAIYTELADLVTV